jgi:hypothetical protein
LECTLLLSLLLTLLLLLHYSFLLWPNRPRIFQLLLSS